MELPGAEPGRAARREPDLRRPRVLSDLRSAPLPEIGPEDHVRGPEHARLVVVYGDYECPFCAAVEVQLRTRELRVAFRHFPVRASHPRAQAAACAAEAAGEQGAFWEMHDALFDDQGRLEDPHLWARAERLGLDIARFDADRRSDRIAQRVRAHFHGGVRAGVATTPTLFVDGERYSGRTALAIWT
jgi:protein-disulfide isomerase